jgi:eukaryotic-like serine/threonine-protein kinase
MVIASTPSLLDALRQYRLLEPVQLEELKSLSARFPDPKTLAGELIRRSWLTPYQANQLLQGRGHELLLGSYVLLERLGEGGMGQVFKARNWKLGRVVALKLIRKERLDNPDAIHRFEREVRSAAALSHPNIVHADDADHVGGTHLLVIEYVEGTDLAKLVKKNGPLPVAQACEYIRQAALGLQHAHERGMVHRDIKPANLLLTADGKTVKILDMGLARFDQPAGDDEKSSTMTQEGMVMGTPDYIAPEQAVESHTVDIRADLYSLGCTFYFLLTGRVPFRGGTFIQKINRHQFEEPPAIEGLRPEVPQEVAAIVRRLMAKKPDDRYQTPAEVATALTAGSEPANGDDRTCAEGQSPAAAAATSGDRLESAFEYMVQRDDTVALDSPGSLGRKEGKRRLLYGVAGGTLALAGSVVLLALLFRGALRQQPPVGPALQGGEETVRVKVDPTVDPDRKAAEYVLSIGGTVRINDQEPDLTKATDLPKVAFRLTWVFLGNNKQVSDAGLAHFKDCKNLTHLHLTQTQVSDAGLAHFKDYKNLTSLALELTKVSNVGLAHFKDCKNLTVLNLSQTQVSDAGVAHFKECKNLACLYLNHTKVSDAGLAHFKDCKNLTSLSLYGVSDAGLAHFKDCKNLTHLELGDTKVSDLSLLKGMALKNLYCDFKPERDAEILRSIKTLETINGKPVEQFWKEVDAKKL